MRLRKLFILIIILCLIPLAGCNNKVELPNNESQDPPKETNNSLPDSIGITFLGGYDEFDRKYIDIVYNAGLGEEIVGKDIAEKWAQEVFLIQKQNVMSSLPTLYQMIRDLSIPRKDFNELNGLYMKNYNELAISETVLDALYAEDETDMMKALMNPIAFYYDGVIYTVNELRSMSAEKIKSLGIPMQELQEFTNRIEVTIIEHVGPKNYEGSYKETIDKLREVIKE